MTVFNSIQKDTSQPKWEYDLSNVTVVCLFKYHYLKLKISQSVLPMFKCNVTLFDVNIQVGTFMGQLLNMVIN